MEHAIQITLGAFIIFFMALSRFNTPTTNRTATGRLAYWGGSFAYATVGLLLFALCLVFPRTADELVRAILSQGGGTSDWVHTVESLSPLVLAMLLGVVLPGFPVFRKIDARILHVCLWMASIPDEVEWLAQRLERDPFSIPVPTDALRPRASRRFTRDDLSVICTELKKFGIPVNAGDGFTGSRRKTDLIRLVCLIVQLEKWKSDRKYGRLLRTELASRYKNLISRYMRLRVRIVQLNGHMANLRPGHDATDAEREWASDVRERIRFLLREACDLVARVALGSSLTLRAPVSKVVTMSVPPDTGGLTWNDWALATALLFASLTTVMLTALLIGGQPAPTDLHAFALRIIMVVMIWLSATWIAVYPKKFETGRRSDRGERPLFTYAWCVLCACGASFAIAYMFRLVKMGEWTLAAADRALTEQVERWPFILLAGALAGAVAWVCDNKWFHKREAVRRVVEASVVAAIMTATAALVYYLLTLGGVAGGGRGPTLLVLSSAGAVAGFFMGWLVPERVRRLTVVHQEPIHR